MSHNTITADKLRRGDTIGIVCPSHVADPARYARDIAVIESLGFSVKLGANVYRDTDGYIASAQERADDLNAMVADGDVKMVLFGGGDGAIELLPLIDYANIRRHPKLFSSYSDGTSILNAIHAQTGLVTYYGQGAGEFYDLRYYDWRQFSAHFIDDTPPSRFVSDSEWRVLRGGTCAGTLIGGYTSIFGLLLSNEYFSYDTSRKYLLFLEDYERFSNVGAVNTYLSAIEQSAFMRQVTGLIFGHYAAEVPDILLQRLERFGAAHDIPVVYTDDFGHGTRHAILPIGVDAVLENGQLTLSY
ncbi:MAG: LD-carboxypeptidase [Oscillospiraceae bacterium]|jgi:muramoyltetrapeptide carboxypeptidase|nr:LD-carboxypeptidase [Oscillospiraceae bacterium]